MDKRAINSCNTAEVKPNATPENTVDSASVLLLLFNLMLLS